MSKKRSMHAAIALIAFLSVIVGCTGNNGATGQTSGETKNETKSEAKGGQQGAAGNSAPTPEPGKKVTISVLTKDATNDPRGIANTKIFSMFNEKHPNITIKNESSSGTSFDEKLATGVATNNIPDFFQNYGFAQVWPLVKNNKVVDLQPYLEKDPAWKNSLTHLSSLDGLWTFENEGIKGLYALPKDIYVMGIYYNKKMFQDYGVQIPETLEDFVKVSKVFIDKGVVPMPIGSKTIWRNGHLYTSLAMAMYGKQLRDDLATGKKKWTGPEMVSVFKTLKDWQSMGIFGKNIASMDYTQETTSFLQGQSPMLFDGPWFIQQIPKDKFPEGTVGFIPFPYAASKPELKNSAMGGPNGAMSISNTGDQDRINAAVELLKYYTSPEITEYKIKSYGGIFPVKTSIKPEELSPTFQEFYKVLDQSKSLSIDFVFYYKYPEMENIVRNGINGMFAGATPEKTAQDIQDFLDKKAK